MSSLVSKKFRRQQQGRRQRQRSRVFIAVIYSAVIATVFFSSSSWLSGNDTKNNNNNNGLIQVEAVTVSLPSAPSSLTRVHRNLHDQHARASAKPFELNESSTWALWMWHSNSTRQRILMLLQHTNSSHSSHLSATFKIEDWRCDFKNAWRIFEDWSTFQSRDESNHRRSTTDPRRLDSLSIAVKRWHAHQWWRTTPKQ